MKNKKLISIFLIIAVLISCLVAAEAADTIIVLQTDSTLMTVNGAPLYIDAPPVIKQSRTLVPVRAVTEAMGGAVSWDGSFKTATLTLDGKTVKLTIGSKEAYFGNSKQMLDVTPEIISGRTMLPIRFISESFGFSVGWDESTRKITITNAGWHFSLYDIPAFSGSPYVTFNSNIPMFSGDQISAASYEYYGELDALGRCTGCIASVGQDIMPREERGKIGMIKPSGWHTVKYDCVDGKYLYNRCHLIGYQLTGENANEKNLITGTRYLNTEGMLPFENKVADYVRQTGNHVMYRAMPVFDGGNLLSSGVLLEAFSVEDNGAGICFCVFCYNAQPGIYINYETGDSAYTGETQKTAPVTSRYVLNTNTKKFHYPSCASASLISEKNRGESNKTRDELIAEGYSPCGVCKP